MNVSNKKNRQKKENATSYDKIDSQRFYAQYHGHPVRNGLDILYPKLRESYDSLIWTAGDSSLDNKYWFHKPKPAVAGVYRDVLNPPTSNSDVTYWLNYLCEQTNNRNDASHPSSDSPTMAAINTAVEATTLNERCYSLREQDKFIRDNISRNDILIVSVGGNDVALAPTPCTILSISSLVCCLPSSCIENGFSCGAIPINDCCCGCGTSLLSCACSFPPCYGYFRHLFGVRVQKYIEALTSKTKPKKILVCMIYYLDETPTPSWAALALGALGYNTNPSKLQLIIRKMFTIGTSTISIPGTDVIPVPLFNVLNGKNPEDYIARVEPSSIGGKKMAEFLLDIINKDHQNLSRSQQRQAATGAGGMQRRIVDEATSLPSSVSPYNNMIERT